MPYNVTYTETNNQNKRAITVADETINNTSTSLTFVGKNYAGYGTYVANNFLHLLENFASPSSPSNPVQGQLWYDNANNQLMINNDGTNNWTSASSVQKSITRPTVANIGDIWVDTISQQLYIYKSGTTWTLVGPLLSQGTSKTGQDIEEITDTSDTVHKIVSIYSTDKRIAIISSDAFTPKITIPGFSSIQAGITMNSNTITVNSTVVPQYKLIGTASNSDSLGGISNLKFVRNDQANTIPHELNVSKINVGDDYNLKINSTGSKYVIESNASGKAIDIIVKTELSGSRSVAYFAPEQRVGIATTAPESTLDVNGTITVSGTSSRLNIKGTGDVSTIGTQTASIQTAGGLYVYKSATIGDNAPTETSTTHDLVISNGSLKLNYLDVTANPVSPTGGSVILPGYQTHVLTNGTYAELTPPYYDIGSPTNRFRNFYVKNFVGDVIGNVQGDLSGNVSGNVSGSAGKLSAITVMKLDGDVTSNVINFDGAGGNVTFDATLSPVAVSSKPELDNSVLNDEMVIFRRYSAQISGYIDGTTLTIGSIDYGIIEPGMSLIGSDVNGNSILGDTHIVEAINPSGATGPVGSILTWRVSKSQSIGTQNEPIIIEVGSTQLYRTTKQTFISDISTVRIGSIILYPGSELPQGYVWCDGSNLAIAMYADLYSILGTSSLVSGSSTLFSIPSLTGPASGINYIIYTGVF